MPRSSGARRRYAERKAQRAREPQTKKQTKAPGGARAARGATPTTPEE